MKSITVKELKSMVDNNTEFQLIDVRESHELEICQLPNHVHIPMNSALDMIDKVRNDVPVIVHCRSGARSAAVIDAMERAKGFDNLHNLTGGILAWAAEIDSSMESY